MYEQYILDSNAIIELTLETINSKKRYNRFIITIDEVAYEVRSQKDKLKVLDIYNLSKSAFNKMKKLINDFECVKKLLDYYNNEGSADVVLLAYSLTVDEDKLIKDEVYIVTNDKPLKNACEILGCKSIYVNEFKDLI